jgi:prevent-host-death family protein
MITANIHEAKTNLSKLIEAAVRGEEVVIARAGKPVAKLVSIPEKKEPRKGGFWKGQVWVAPDEEMKDVDEEIARLFNESKLDI